METEFIYWRHPSIPGIKIEEICGGEDKKGALWREMAYQVYCENGREGFRELGHYQNGAPFIYGEDTRISISHTDGLLVVATLPPTPEVDLSVYTPRAAMGVDTERADREQALRIRERFLSEEELALAASDDVAANVLLWTCKEACYKAVLGDGLDLRRDIRIVSVPKPGPAVPVYDKAEFPEIVYGKAIVKIKKEENGETGSEEVELTLYSYESEGHIVTLAYSPRCSKFSRK